MGVSGCTWSDSFVLTLPVNPCEENSDNTWSRCTRGDWPMHTLYFFHMVCVVCTPHVSLDVTPSMSCCCQFQVQVQSIAQHQSISDQTHDTNRHKYVSRVCTPVVHIEINTFPVAHHDVCSFIRLSSGTYIFHLFIPSRGDSPSNMSTFGGDEHSWDWTYIYPVWCTHSQVE